MGAVLPLVHSQDSQQQHPNIASTTHRYSEPVTYTILARSRWSSATNKVTKSVGGTRDLEENSCSARVTLVINPSKPLHFVKHAKVSKNGYLKAGGLYDPQAALEAAGNCRR